jgi:hypothetical protein
MNEAARRIAMKLRIAAIASAIVTSTIVNPARVLTGNPVLSMTEFPLVRL